MGLQLSGSVQLEGNLLVTGSAGAGTINSSLVMANSFTVLPTEFAPGGLHVGDFTIGGISGDKLFVKSNYLAEDSLRIASSNGNVIVTGKLIAQEIETQFVSASIIYSSGSNKFGDESGDKHQFTGSVDVSGSLSVNGAGSFSSTLATEGNITVTANSAAVRVTESGGADVRIVAGGSSGFLGTYSNHPLIFLTNSENKLTISGSGVGIGVTPNAWAGTNVKALQVYLGSMAASLTFGTAFTWNSFYDGSWRYTGPYTAGKYEIGGDEHIWYSAPVGAAAGDVAPFINTMKLTGAGSLGLGLGASNPDTNAKLHIADTANGFVGMRLSGSGNFTGTDWTLYASSEAAPSANDFFGIYNNSTTDSATADYKLKVYKDGNVSITNGNLVIGTAGKGIDFSTTTNGSGSMTSELLDDYEEGTWTPTYTGTNITVTNYGSQGGYYTKVGRLVTVTFRIMTEAVTVIGSENVSIAGLPFAAANVTENINAVNIFDNSRWVSTPPVGGSISPGTSIIQLTSNIGNIGAGGDPTPVLSANMATGAGNRNMVRATATYFTA